jgi:hypothetical protein
MAQQTWCNLLNHGEPWQTAQGAVLNTAVTATISPQAPTGQDFILPGQDNGLQWYRQMSLRIRARGTLSTGATTANFTWALAVGPSGMGSGVSVLCTTAAVVMGATSIGPVAWNLQAAVDCVAVGSTGTTLTADGNVICGNSTTPAFVTANAVMINMPFTSTAFNTYTQGTAIALRGTLSAAFGSYQCNHFAVEQIS